MTEIAVNFYLFLKMLQPPFLKNGNTVAIISTARKISLEEIKPTINLLKSWKLNVVIGKTIGASEHQFAGSEELRISDFQTMLDNPDINAIWCARGGYGSVKIIDEINFNLFLNNPKWIIGLSDITVLHSQIYQLGVQTTHATMPINILKNTKNSLNSLKSTLFGLNNNQKLPFSKFNKKGIATGILVGGNLSILYSLLGSKSAINTDGKVLFIEDFDEYIYHIDKMIVALKRGGVFKNLKGLVVVGMTQLHDNEVSFGKTIEELILDNLSDYDFPICFDFKAGHIDDNNAFILGNEVMLTVTEKQVTIKTLN